MFPEAPRIFIESMYTGNPVVHIYNFSPKGIPVSKLEEGSYQTRNTLSSQVY